MKIQFESDLNYQNNAINSIVNNRYNHTTLQSKGNPHARV